MGLKKRQKRTGAAAFFLMFLPPGFQGSFPSASSANSEVKRPFLQYQGWQRKTGDSGKILEKHAPGASKTAKIYSYLRFEWQIPDNFRPLQTAL